MKQNRYSTCMPSLPWDVAVLGIPASVQGSSARRQQWKAAVSTAALAAWPSGDPPLARPVQFKVTYFHQGAPLDVDNMIKPIQDALIGIVYDDDKWIVDTHGSKRDLTGLYRLVGMTPALAHGFTSKGPFVHVRIDEPPNMQELP